MQQLNFFTIILFILFLTGCKTMENYIDVTDAMGLENYVDKKVKVTGKISGEPWQHLVGSFKDFRESYYFDVDDYQILIYSKKPINCETNLTVYGSVVKVSGRSKRPEDEVEEYTEYHIQVDTWTCGK
ncbi:MAG: hypothetical protein JXJ04_12610 [Spirochaetales bacterium]|nr:hypothetical protein [Spirochaetales bacterium]